MKSIKIPHEILSKTKTTKEAKTSLSQTFHSPKAHHPKLFQFLVPKLNYKQNSKAKLHIPTYQLVKPEDVEKDGKCGERVKEES